MKKIEQERPPPEEKKDKEMRGFDYRNNLRPSTYNYEADKFVSSDELLLCDRMSLDSKWEGVFEAVRGKR